jgi:hypothetical protein
MDRAKIPKRGLLAWFYFVDFHVFRFTKIPIFGFTMCKSHNRMKNIRPIYLITLIVLNLTWGSFTVKAQSQSDLSAFLQAQKNDASKLIAAYTTPAIKAVSYGMTNGWYHTGKAHNKLGVDLGISFSAVMIPTSDNHFNTNAIGLSSTKLVSPSTGLAPTIFGPKETTTYSSTYQPSGSPTPVVVNFNGPEGLDLKKSIGTSAVPVPMIQLGIGLIMNTDLKIRYVPEQTIGATKLHMLGFGLLHDIKQHIPGVKLAPFDLSVLAAYNSVNGSTSLVNSNPTSSRPVSPDGKATYKLNSWVAQVIVSKKFSVVTLYAGVGYGSVSTKFNETGTYTINTTAPPGSFTTQIPVAINFDNKGVKATVGMRLKFGPIYLNGDYTLQKYNALTVGLGVSVR